MFPVQHLVRARHDGLRLLVVERPSSMLTERARLLDQGQAADEPGGMRSPEILKCCRERWVCAPQGVRGDLDGPKVSFSVRVLPVMPKILIRVPAAPLTASPAAP